MKTREIALCLALVLLVTMFWMANAWLERPEQASDAAGDAYRMYIPNISYSIETMKSGAMPLWNPYEFAGMPLFGTLEYGPLYPLTWIYALGPPHEMHLVSAWLHGLLLCVFMYCFCRYSLRLLPGAAAVGALIAALSGWAVTKSFMWPDEFRSAVYIPLVLLMLDANLRKPGFARALGLACVLAIQFFAGEVEVTLRVAQLGGVYVVFRLVQFWREGTEYRKIQNGVLGLFAAAVVALGLVAVQLLPAIEASGQSMRTTGGLSFDMVNRSATGTWSALLEALIQQPAGTHAWFLGAIPLALMAYALWRRSADGIFFTCCALFIAGLMVGEGSWIARLYYHLPTGDWFRWPERWLPFFVVSVAAASAVGLNQLLQRVRGTEARSEGAKWDWVVFGLSVSLLFQALVQWPSRELLVPLGLLALLGACLAWTILKRRQNLAEAAVIGCALAGVVLTPFLDHDIQSFVPPRDLDLTGVPAPIQEYLDQNLRPGERVYVDYVLPDARRVPKFGLVTEIPSVNGFSPFMPASYWDLVGRGLAPHLQPAPEDAEDFLPIGLWGGLALESGADEVLSMLGTRYLVLGFGNVFGLDEATTDTAASFVEVLQSGEFRLYENQNPYPRAVVLETVPKTPADLKAGLPATITEYAPNRVIVEVPGPDQGVLILTDQYYPGWRVGIDGVKAEIEESAGAFRQVEFPAGASKVEFIYAPTSFRAGLAITSLTLLACIAALAFIRRRSNIVIASEARQSTT